MAQGHPEMRFHELSMPQLSAITSTTAPGSQHQLEEVKGHPEGGVRQSMERKKSRKGSKSKDSELLRESVKKEGKAEDIQEDSTETDFCIKGHDYLVSISFLYI